jgi:glycogen debranching enzyme
MLSLIGYQPTKALRFGESSAVKFRQYKQWLDAKFLPHLVPDDQKEPSVVYQSTLASLKQKGLKVAFKKPGSQTFWISTPDGFVNRAKQIWEQPEGFFVTDTQYIRHYVIKGPKGCHLTGKANTGMNAAEWVYRVNGHPELQVKRVDTAEAKSLHQLLTIQNQGNQPAQFHIEIDSSGKDLFEVRYPTVKGPQKQYQSFANDHSAVLTTAIKPPNPESPPANILQLLVNVMNNDPDVQLKAITPNTLRVQITVPPHAEKTVPLLFHTVNLLLDQQGAPAEFDSKSWDNVMPTIRIPQNNAALPNLPKVWQTASDDIKSLMIPIQIKGQTHYIVAAGMPNYVAPFGRDALITAMQLLPFNPNLAKDTLQVTAYYQGDGYDAWRDMEPGSIMHELRHGEMTRLKMSPYSPYYGTMDAPPLFTMLFEQYIQRTKDLVMMKDLWPNYEKALAWIDRHISPADTPLSGFLSQRYRGVGDNEVTGSKNIGWKDSGYSMRHILAEDGKLHDPKYPIAPAEVQAYVYAAWQGAARLYMLRAKEAGVDHETRDHFIQNAKKYKQKALTLQKQFNQQYWMPEKQFFATALQADGTQLASVSSNGIHALYGGIVYPDLAQKMVQRVLQKDMLSGWGVRTLSALEPSYDPLSYQNGSIWPHDNAMIVAGLSRYGLKSTAATITNQILSAANSFENARLPELYAGFEQKKTDRQVIPYPNMGDPQAWCAGTPFMLLSSMLGLEINAFKKKITFNQPHLPANLPELELKHLSLLPDEQVDIHFKQMPDKTVEVTPLSPLKSYRLNVIQH